MAMAAMAFMGWTHMGMPKSKPVVMLKRPAKKRTEHASSPVTAMRAAVSGMNVPMSPHAPENSFLP